VWQHFAVVKSGANVKHYVNGIKTAECNASSATISTNDLPLRIGEWSGGSNRNWNGTIDEVRISNRALLPSEFLPVEHDTAVNLMPGAAVRVGSDAIMAFDNVTENGTITSDGTLYRYKYYPIHVVNGSNANVAAASVNITDNFTLEFTNVTADGSGWAYPHAFVSATNNSVLMTVKHNLTAAKAGYGYNSIWMNTSAGNQTISLGSLSGYMIVNNVTATGFVPNVTVSTSPLAGPYYGVRTVEIRNGSQPVVTFQHDFSAGDLDLGTLTVRLGQYWVGFDGKLPATLYVPIRGVYCNVHVCPGITNTSETCSAGWSEWSSEPQGWYCLTTINGTVAEEQLDPAVTKLVAAPMSWEAVMILFFIAGGIVVFGKLMALRRPRKWRHKRKHKR
jgi:hypothetical protein